MKSEVLTERLRKGKTKKKKKDGTEKDKNRERNTGVINEKDRERS